jgi:hypothetical protein
VLDTVVVENEQCSGSANTREEVSAVVPDSQAGNEPDSEPVDLHPGPETHPEPAAGKESLEVARYGVQGIENQAVEERKCSNHDALSVPLYA